MGLYRIYIDEVGNHDLEPPTTRTSAFYRLRV